MSRKLMIFHEYKFRDQSILVFFCEEVWWSGSRLKCCMFVREIVRWFQSFLSKSFFQMFLDAIFGKNLHFSIFGSPLEKKGIKIIPKNGSCEPLDKYIVIFYKQNKKFRRKNQKILRSNRRLKRIIRRPCKQEERKREEKNKQLLHICRIQ